MDARQAYFSAIVSVLLAAGAATVVSPAHAQTQDSPARALFKEGRLLASDGKYAEACPKFEASLQLELGVGTQFNLADCWEHLGRTASAQKLFRGAAASAKAAGQTDREQVLRERATALEPRISKLVIDVEDTSTRLIVKRGDVPLDKDEWGQAVAVDPGTYELSAKAPGKKPWRKTIEVKPGVAITSVEVPRLEAAEDTAVVVEPQVAPRPTPQAPRKANPTPAPASSPPDRDRDRAGNYRAAATLAGIGLAGVTLGTVMAFRFNSKNDEASSICPTSVGCSPDEIDRHSRLVDQARTARAVMYVGGSVGLIGLGAAAFFFVVDKPRGERAASWQAAPVLGPGQLGAAVSGAF